jgi:hypothetical protein
MAKNPVASITTLLSHYSFDTGNQTVDQVTHQWLNDYPAKWVLLAVVEAIYQGRHKAASVDKILSNWEASQRPQHHFDLEFADLVCNKLFKDLPSQPTTVEVNPVEPRRDAIAPPPREAFVKPEVAPTGNGSSRQGANGKRPSHDINRWVRLHTKL